MAQSAPGISPTNILAKNLRHRICISGISIIPRASRNFYSETGSHSLNEPQLLILSMEHAACLKCPEQIGVHRVINRGYGVQPLTVLAMADIFSPHYLSFLPTLTTLAYELLHGFPVLPGVRFDRRSCTVHLLRK